ncbi:hypothetical protein [Pedobacter sp.]|jgi:hypothetical protein|uniref:hypothetical protein n=1 Tax=Pedobacter sp. TaxID=1411316 RepID=UPI002D010699|nr:hypothetical protein [Pedobacter sp.]HWW41725.1 hypothetical protein [Pedobacter sp.]
MKEMIAQNELEKYCNQLIVSWRDSFGREKYEDALKLTADFIEEIKPLYRSRPYGEGEEAGNSYTYAYIFLVLAKAFEDITGLAELTSDKYWPEDPKKAELIWQVLWDAKERMDIVNSHCMDRDLFEDLYTQLKQLEISFYDQFGKGIYMSPVIKIKKAICSICKFNIKACNHIPGNIYHGHPCREIVDDMEFTGVDMVPSPHDMRCRIWPWNFTEENKFTARVMNLNQLDKFINE